jgi:sugar phosphate isomerase/epimerase
MTGYMKNHSTETRRGFIRKIGIGSAFAALGTMPSLASLSNAKGKKKSKNGVSLNLGLQEGVAPGDSLSQKLDFMEANGVYGLEVGGGNLAARVPEFQKALQNRKVKISAICAGFKGWLISTEESERKKCIDTSKEILAAAGTLGSYGMILVPGFNGQKPSFPFVEARAILIDQLKELGEFAVKNNTTVILEPLNRKEAWFLRQVSDAAAICRDVNSPGVTCMGDFWHMTWEETDDMGAFISGQKYLNHVHVASRKTRKAPGEDEGDNYVTGFKALKMINYQHFVSFECGTKGDKKVVIPAALKLLRDQWDLA